MAITVVIDNTPTGVVSWIKVATSGPWDAATPANPIGISVNGHVYSVIGTQSDGNLGSGGRMLLTSTPVAAADNKWGLVGTLVPLATTDVGRLVFNEPSESLVAHTALPKGLSINEAADRLVARGRTRIIRARSRSR